MIKELLSITINLVSLFQLETRSESNTHSPINQQYLMMLLTYSLMIIVVIVIF